VALVDRYLDSTLAYQGVAGGLGFEKVIDIHSHSPLNTLPHMTFYLQISLKTSMDRQQIRGNEKDYFESRPKEFHQKLIEGYDKAAHEFQDRFIVIDGEKSMEEVFSEITQAWEGYES
jgi:dTMP kinase